jgi:hypothetical protein
MFLCPEIKSHRNTNKVLRWYHSKWVELEKKLFQKKEVRNVIDEEMKILDAQLKSKYKLPDYNTRQVHQFLKPYIITEEESFGEDKDEDIKF